MNNKRYSQLITVFHDRKAPEEGYVVGYGTLIDSLDLKVPIPSRLSLIG